MSSPVAQKQRTPSPREALLDLIRQQGILRAAPGQPVIDRTGRSAEWMFYSWNFSLTAQGAALAARCLLDALKNFGSTQLATYGATGIPLVSACVMAGEGKYTGISIREKPKGNARGRQIEGPADRTRPVVIIDDSLSSGRSLLSGIQVLESWGFEVEGAVCLVHFPYRGGRERAEALGYRVETLFDIWRDVGMQIPVYVPGFQRVGAFQYGANSVEDDLSPAQVARRVAEQLLREGTLPRPPHRFNRRWNDPGGAWVSFRDRRTNIRIARDGFWHFNPGDADPCRDVVLATAKTVRNGRLGAEQLEHLKIGVTFFGELEPIEPSGLDFSQYGIVVRSKAWPVKTGGALPNSQVFISEREQLDLALRNGQIGPFEPYQLYRHTIAKFVEPGETWLPYGTADPPEHAWTKSAAIGAALTQRARKAAQAALAGVPLTGVRLDRHLIPARVAAVGITLYRNGVVGCSVSSRKILDDAVVSAAAGAARDKRFGIAGLGNPDEICPSVSVLYDPEWIGHTAKEKAARKLRLGRDSISVQQGERRAIFLESVAPHYSWGKEQVIAQLLRKASADPAAPAHWTTYRTATWLADGDRAVPHVFGFAEPAGGGVDAASLRDDLALLGGYIERNFLPGGLPRYAQRPAPGWNWDEGSVARAVHGLSGLGAAGRCLRRAAWRQRSDSGILACLAEFSAARFGPMARCVLLTAVVQAGVSARHPRRNALAAAVAAMIRDDGSIHSGGQPVRLQRDNDFLPGAAMLALASHYAATPAMLAALMEPCHTWQLRRFQRMHLWGQAGWLPQACRATYDATGDPHYADTAFEIADWCLDRQVAATGAFLTDLAPGGPTFHTAFIAEGIADAWALALARGDAARARRYEAACFSAMRFMRRLIVRPVDTPCLADGNLAVGGVRCSFTDSTVRIDFVSHTIFAMVKALRIAETLKHQQRVINWRHNGRGPAHRLLRTAV